MSCTLPFQIDGIQWSEDPLIIENVGRTSTNVKAELTGFISSPDLATLTADIATLQTNSRISGLDLTITGVAGNVLHQILASDCYEAGPHIAFTVLDADGGLYRRVKATAVAKSHLAQLLHNYRLRIRTAVDGLVTVSQEGTLRPSAASAMFTSTVLPAFEAAYPSYLITFEVDYPFGTQISEAGATTSITDEITRYRINAVQLASPLPTGGTAVVVDGEVTQRSETDEQQRVTTTTEYELQLQPNTGDYTSLVNALRPASGTPGGTQLVRESVRFSKIKAWRLQVGFVQIGSADGDGLLNCTRTVTYVPNEQSFDIYTYPGISPIAVARPTTFTKVTDTGSMTSLGEFLPAPDPLVEIYAEPPSFKYTDISNAEKRTEWEYSMIDTTGEFSIIDVLPLIQRPTTVGTGVL
jgi:hypothetical protein